MSTLEWAKNEIDLAIKHEKELCNNNPEEYCYGVECYNAALEVYNTLCSQGHSGMSIKITQSILNRLIDGKPLTPIEDTPDSWSKSERAGIIKYQCNRMSSLFKTVCTDGDIKYTDIGRVVCFTTDNPNSTFTCGTARNIIDEMFPIKMPYVPETKPYMVKVEEFLIDPKNGDFDTQGFLEVKLPNGEIKEIGRYFTEKDNKLTEISKEEYSELKNKRLNHENR